MWDYEGGLDAGPDWIKNYLLENKKDALPVRYKNVVMHVMNAV
jgi:hypothetical protein